MEIYQQFDAVWCGTTSNENYCVIKITIDISNIKEYLVKFDLFTITNLFVECKNSYGSNWSVMEYEYTRIFRNIKENIIQFNVTVYGNKKNIKIHKCGTRGFYV